MIIEIKDKSLIKFFITNPILWEMTGYSGSPEEFIPNMNYIWLLHDNNCLMELRKFNSITYDAHIYTLPDQMRKGIGKKAISEAIEWIKENTDIKKILLTVPLSCEHVIKFLQKTEFKVCGMLHESIIYKNQIQDLVLYELGV